MKTQSIALSNRNTPIAVQPSKGIHIATLSNQKQLYCPDSSFAWLQSPISGLAEAQLAVPPELEAKAEAHQTKEPAEVSISAWTDKENV